MGWKIESVDFEGHGGTVRAFNYVYSLPEGSGVRPASYRGDGLLISGRTVRLNREQFIKHTALQHGIDPAELISGISSRVASEVAEYAQAV